MFVKSGANYYLKYVKAIYTCLRDGGSGGGTTGRRGDGGGSKSTETGVDNGVEVETY